MSPDFANRVADSAWRESAGTWLRERTQEQGISLTGELQQIRIRPWSAHWVAESDAGLLWFKASCSAMGFEPALQTELAQLVPGSVQAPLAIDAERGWMVTLDQGPVLAEEREESLGDWTSVLSEVIDLQQSLMPHRERLLATRMPDCSPETVVERFDRLSILLGDLPPDHPSHLSQADRADLASARDELVQACRVLQAAPVGCSWQHGDTHLNNVFASGGRMRVFDFGDSQWGHVLEMLVVPFSILSTEHPDWWQLLRRSCAQAWGLSDGEFDVLWNAARRTQAVNRSFTWHSVADEINPEAHPEWARAPRTHLMRSISV